MQIKKFSPANRAASKNTTGRIHGKIHPRNVKGSEKYCGSKQKAMQVDEDQVRSIRVIMAAGGGDRQQRGTTHFTSALVMCFDLWKLSG